MIQTEIRVKTRVLAGRRVEISAPQFAEGEEIEVVLRKQEQTPIEAIPLKMGVWDYIQSLPPSDLTLEDWAEIERDFREGRDSWGD